MRNITSLLLLIVLPLWMTAQEETEKKQSYEFTAVKEVKATPVKSQSRSGTCWSFATATFVESELLKMGKAELDLSEMFVVRKAYEEKADMYVRMHGSANFGGGGAVNDVIDVISKYGIMPEAAYSGLEYGEKIHVHGELDELLKAYVDVVVSNPNRKLSSAWKKGFNGILDAYLGAVPENFEYNGKSMTPKEFAETYVPINPNDYYYFSSFTHHPFYAKFILEVPDNWTFRKYFNLPLDELMSVIDNAVNEGHSVSWAADVSERSF